MVHDEQRRRRVGLVAIRETTATLAVLGSLIGNWMAGKTIVWVDDHPENNAVIRVAFKDAGARVFLARSTGEGMDLLQSKDATIDLVISDMGRGDDPVAGLNLLAAMHLSGMATPRIIYSDSPLAREQSRQISEKGGIGPVVGPEQLARAVSRVFGESESPTK